MKITNNRILVAVIFLLATTSSFAQMGIGTLAPEGMLDIQNSNSTGFIYPRVALTSTAVAAPVINPNGGGLAEGTVVFNTSTTTTGLNDVTPGVYVWDSTQWIPQYLREDAALFEQFPLDFRTVTGDTSYNTGSSDWADVPGLGVGVNTFTPKYTGTYKIKTSFNFGTGKIILPGTGDIMMGTMEGLIRLTFDGTPHLTYTHSYGLYNGSIGFGTFYDQFKHDSSYIIYVNLVAGQAYDFSLEVDIFVANHAENGGNSGDGRGHVGIGVPCTVEFTFQDV